MLNKVKD